MSQTTLFSVDGYTVDEHRVSLGAAGYVAVEEGIRLKARVNIAATGYVGKVNVSRNSNGRIVRQAVVIVEVDTMQVTPTGDVIEDDAEGNVEDDGQSEREDPDGFFDPQLERDQETRKQLEGVLA